MVLTLFHGQASVERGFNINKAVLQPNLMNKSLTSQKLVYDHMKARKSDNAQRGCKKCPHICN